MTTPRVLVAGIGNVFMGDDGFGVAVVQKLRGARLPAGVEAIDFGIRGHDLGFALTSGYDAAILVDATPRGRAPGTLYVIDLDEVELPPVLDTHGMDPAKVLGLARTLGKTPGTLRLVGCEPKSIPETDEDMTMELSAEASAAVERAVDVVLELAASLANGVQKREDAHA
jgi:hydrogenase maturation protease